MLGLSLIPLATLALAAPDEKLLAAARAAQPAVIESLKEMAAIESGTMDSPGIAKLADYAEARLKALGMHIERSGPVRGKGSMIQATLTGSGKKKLMLMAHMDTVYWPGILASQPIKLEGNRLYGPGVADDKGGIAVILHALAILRDAGWRDYAQITVLLNGDEESGSTDSGETIASLADRHDVVLSYEPIAAKAVAKDEGVLLAAAGVGAATMEVKGRAAHAGAAPDQGRNALVELSYQVLQTQDIAKGIPGTQLNWTIMQSGQTLNQIPDKAKAIADVRLLAPGAAEKLNAALQAKVAESKRVPETEVSVKVEVGRPPFVGDERTRALAVRAQAIYAELDGRTLLLYPMSGGGTDAGYANRGGKAAVLESLGLAGWGYHAKDEYIEVDSIVPRLYLSTRMLMDLAKD